MLVRKQCPFCSKQTELDIDEIGLQAYRSGAKITAAFPNLDSFDREVLLTGICYDCQEKVFNTPTKKNESSWGKYLGECPICGSNVYELKHKSKEQPSQELVQYSCGGCYAPMTYNPTTGDLRFVGDDLDECDPDRYQLAYSAKTGKWWVYDTQDNGYITVPYKIKDKLRKYSDDIEAQEDILKGIVDKVPKWVSDGYRRRRIEM